MSIHVERFAFDRVFSAPVSEKKLVDEDALIELAALRAEVALLKADQQAVIDKARAEGFEAGLAQARSERDVALLSAVDALHAGIEVIDAQFTEITERVTSEATEVALAAADHIAARAIERAPGEAIDAAIGRLLGQVARGTELQVRVHPDLVEDIEAKIADRQSRDRRKLSLTVAPDATLAMGDALINWDEGGLALNAQARRDAVAAELESLLLH